MRLQSKDRREVMVESYKGTEDEILPQYGIEDLVVEMCIWMGETKDILI